MLFFYKEFFKYVNFKIWINKSTKSLDYILEIEKCPISLAYNNQYWKRDNCLKHAGV